MSAVATLGQGPSAGAASGRLGPVPSPAAAGAPGRPAPPRRLPASDFPTPGTSLETGATCPFSGSCVLDTHPLSAAPKKCVKRSGQLYKAHLPEGKTQSLQGQGLVCGQLLVPGGS